MQLLAKQVVTVMVCTRAHHVLVKSWLVYNHEVAKFMDHLKAPVDCPGDGLKCDREETLSSCDRKDVLILCYVDCQDLNKKKIEQLIQGDLLTPHLG